MSPRKQQRQALRAYRAMRHRMAALDGGGQREKDRRVAQMLAGRLTESNGVVKQYDSAEGE